MSFFRKKNKKESSNDLIEYTKSESYNSGKKYFSLGNFGVFEIMNGLGESIMFDSSNLKGVPFANISTYDGDQLYILFIGLTDKDEECGIYINHGHYLPYSSNKNACLSKPLFLAESIKELFRNQDLTDVLQTREIFEQVSESSYYSSEIVDKTVSGYLPQIDIRILFKGYSEQFLTVYHEEYNAEQLNNYFKDASLKVEDEFKSFPHQEDYDRLVTKANTALGKQEFFYTCFESSGYHGIGRFSELSKEQTHDFLCLGMFYRMLDIDSEYYELNEKVHNTVYSK